jgi:hypothetical protein
MDCVCQILLKRNLSHKIEKWCKDSSHVKAKLCKKNSLKKRPSCAGMHGNKMCKRNRSYMFTSVTGLFRKGVVTVGIICVV